MRKLILGTMTAVAMALGTSGAVFAAPASHDHERDGRAPAMVNMQRADYYWDNHRYHHRDWDRDHHRWHYYD